MVEKREQVGLLPTICLRAQLTIGWTNVEMTETTANFLAQVATIAPAAYSRESCASILQGHTYVAAGDLERFESQYGALLVRLSARRSTGPSHIHRSLRYLFRTGAGSSPPVITGFDERRALVEIYHLLGSAYFSRQWILPDFVLSSHIVLRCSSIDLAWDTLCDAIGAMVTFGSFGELGSPHGETVLVANMLRQQYCQSRLSFIETILAVQSCDLQASDPRDHVYALTALSNSPPKVPLPDYSMSPVHVFASVCRTVNSCLGSPITLALAGLAKEDSNAPLPSWVLNFGVYQQRLLLGHPVSNFSTSAVPQKSLPDATFDDNEDETLDEDDGLDATPKDEDRLKCSGYVVDTIKAVQSYLPPRRICDQYDMTGDNLFEFVRWYEYACSTETPRVRYGSDALLLRFTEVIQARGCNHIWESDQPVPPMQTISLARAFFAYLDNPQMLRTNALRVFVAACLPSHDRRFGLTARDRFCLIPGNTTPGDLVWVIRGLKVPIVLRKAGAFYRNVGECYVEGIMFGEAEGTDEDITIV
ncbi:unnamed protein product [Zymoseptoria tritici ST99CH_3D1]|nr:unnamed protein product [Zymoseptoria tritici ST99CH_3D1]